MLTLLAVVVGGYLLGSLPTALVVGRFTRGVDVRDHGSGNVGATNVLRVAGWGPALVVFLVDVAKGAGAALLGTWLRIDPPILDAAWLPFVGGGGAGNAPFISAADRSASIRVRPDNVPV